ncbi:MAG: ParB/RepB/Spo0J family partition protein [Acidiphilium sp.]
MSAALLEIDIERIDVVDRLREVDLAQADQIALSMKEVGQITPIEVRSTSAGRYELVSGAHRLAAAQRIGLTTISAVLFEGDDETARLREIDENLYRRELSPFDQAEFLAERRVVWERLYGAPKRGGDRRSKGQIVPLADAMRQSGFVKETAARFNLHPKTVKRALTRKAHIAPAVWSAIKGTAAAENGSLLDKLRKAEPDIQVAALELSRERGCGLDVALGLMRREEKAATSLRPERDDMLRAFCRAVKVGAPEALAALQEWFEARGEQT